MTILNIGLLSKATYAQLWGYAQENGLVVDDDIWLANIGAHWFVDVSDSQFRVPDLRNQFRRYTGTDVDNETTRALGSWQNDALQNITGHFYAICDYNSPFPVILFPSGAFQDGGFNFGTSAIYDIVGNGVATKKVDFDASVVARTSSETRGTNVAFHPRIHV